MATQIEQSCAEILQAAAFSRPQVEALLKMVVLAGTAGVQSVQPGAGIEVDATDPHNPEVALNAATLASLDLADDALQPGENISLLFNDAGYLEEAPIDGEVYARKDGGWFKVGVGPVYAKQQEFKVSGTFTLPATASPWVEVLLVGGGAGGDAVAAGNGGSGGCSIKRTLHITAPQTVTIGSGGASGANGSASTFGALLTASGGLSSGVSAGEGSGGGGAPVKSSNQAAGNGSVGAHGFGGGGGGGKQVSSSSRGNGASGAGSGGTEVAGNQTAAAANTGGGGGGAGLNAIAGQGGSGICIVTYWDSVP